MSSTPPKTNTNLSRPPVVAVMGHIDHGKSSLLDYIRKTNITEKEAGGITQKMSAYKVQKADEDKKIRSITFLDTPGHEAFCELRSRGASVADIAILVVAADEGIKPQTVEALDCIKKANLPLIIAMNKIDRPNANIDKVKQQLAEAEVYVEGYGGEVPAVPVSAITGEGVEELLQMIILLSDILDLKADDSKNAEGVVIEAFNDKNKGISATLIIKDGSIKTGQFVVCESSFAPTRIMEDFQGKKIESSHPSDPVKIVGFSTLPPVGSIFEVVNSKKEAEEKTEQFKLSGPKIPTTIVIGGETENAITIPMIIKASTTDVIEAIIHELKKIKSERVALKILYTGVGFISENDVKTAGSTPGSVIVGFETKIDTAAKTLAERLIVPIESFNIIYKLTEWMDEFVKNKTPKMKVEEMTGRAKILKYFSKTKDKQVVGARVEDGSISVDSEVKILRRDTEIGKGKIKILQQSRVETKEIKDGEFGATIESKIELAPGDKIEAYKIVEK